MCASENVYQGDSIKRYLFINRYLALKRVKKKVPAGYVDTPEKHIHLFADIELTILL